MKRKAIYLDASNDLSSTLGKLERVEAEEVILVIPQSSVLCHSVVNFKILKSEIQRKHQLLAIVTVDAKGQQLAQRVGIPVYKDLELSEELSTAAPSTTLSSSENKAEAAGEIKIKYKRKLPTSRPSLSPTVIQADAAPTSSPGNPLSFKLPAWQPGWNRSVGITGWVIGALLVLGVVIYLAVPRATINLEISAEPFSHRFKLVLADENDKEAVGQSVFKGRFVVVEKKLTQSFATTGVKNNGNPAGGTLTVYNYTRSSKPLGLRAQTRFLSPDQQVFRSQEEVLVASASTGAGGKLIPGRGQVRVVAESGGTQGNLPTNTKFTIPGLGTIGIDMVYGQNIDPLVGGTDMEVKMISESDLKNAQDSISKNVFVDAEAELQKQVNSKKEELIPALIQNDIINVMPSAAVGTAKENFDLDIHVRSWALLPSKGYLDEIMQTTIASVVPVNRSLTPQTLKSARVVLDHADFSAHIIDFTVAIEGLVAPKISPAELSESLANRNLDSVENLFNSIPDIVSHTVKLWPFWVKKMPLLESNIKINFVYIGNESTGN